MATTRNGRTTAQRRAQAPQSPNVEIPEGYEEVDDGDVDSIVILNEGDSISGVYRGFRLTHGANQKKESKLHKLQLEEGGESVGIWGSHQLDAKLSKIKEGDGVWISHTGRRSLDNGNEMKEYRVAKIALPF